MISASRQKRIDTLRDVLVPLEARVGREAHRVTVELLGVDESRPGVRELVQATLRGIRRTRGCAQREAKPLLRDDLLIVLDTTGEGLKDIRDCALLLTGFAGALRRSE